MTRGKADSKVTFVLDPDAWHGSSTESLWATEIGPGQYRLENSPFYAVGVSFDDIVLARPQEGRLQFVEPIKRGGHSTYRIITSSDASERFESFWKALESCGCTYEEGTGGLLAVDVPPESNIHEVYAALEAGEQQGVWSFEEGHCGHAVG
ncbi:MAG TPA: DUF4265 domain-containing protein [Polyangiaceae bacterium]|nr:DUF4265 domain-containing protein [Polyangiaceae bacterium]